MSAGDRDLEQARARLSDSRSELAKLVEGARATSGRPPRLLRAMEGALRRRLLERRPVRELVSRLEKHDLEAHRHALGGAKVAVLLGSALGLDRDTLTRLGEAALLRDTGLLAVDAGAIWNRAGDPRGFESHPVRGAARLLGEAGIDPLAAVVALEHHARFDLGGFPRLRAVRGQHAFSRIVAVASDYDLWTGGYPGERRLEPALAVRDLVQGAGTNYDPSAVRGLLRLIGFVPEGTAVTLRDRSYGVVAGSGARSWLAPAVALLRDGDGTEIEPRVVETDSLAPAGEAVVLRAACVTRRDLERLRPLVDVTPGPAAGGGR